MRHKECKAKQAYGDEYRRSPQREKEKAIKSIAVEDSSLIVLWCCIKFGMFEGDLNSKGAIVSVFEIHATGRSGCTSEIKRLAVARTLVNCKMTTQVQLVENHL